MSIQEALDVMKKENTDSYGLLVQKDGDAGDQAHKTGLLYFALKKLGYATDQNGFDLEFGYKRALDLLEKEPGLYVRGLGDPRYETTKSNEKFSLTRDQTNTLIMAMGEFGDKDRILRQVKEMQKRNWVYQDGHDIPSPEHIGYYVRGLNKNIYPFTVLGDCFLALNSVIRVVASVINADDVSNDVMHIQALIYSLDHKPTFMTKIARFIYKFRLNAGKTNKERLTGFGPQTALDHYFRPEAGGPPLNELYRPLVEKYLK